MQQTDTKTKLSIDRLDVRIAVAVAICYLTATILDVLNIKFTYGTMHLEIIQKMTACITCLLCCQDDQPSSRKAGINRLIITAIGGIVAIVMIALDDLIQNPWVMVPLAFVGILLTLSFCKAAKVPYINARIGGVTFILVSTTLSGSSRIIYGIFRFVSTFYGVLIVMLVGWIFSSLSKKVERPNF